MKNNILSIAKSIPKKYYGLEGSFESLPGELDHNWLFTATDQRQYVLKILSPERTKSWLDFQVSLLNHVKSAMLDLSCPKVIYTLDLEPYFTIEDEISGHRHFVWMLSWIPGRVWAKVNPKTRSLRTHLGSQLAHLQWALKDFQHPYAQHVLKWDLAQAAWVAPYLNQFPDAEKQSLAHYYFQAFQDIVLPLVDELPTAVNHNDANDYNIVVSNDLLNPSVQSFIDFGDAVYTFRINDIAIAAAYTTMGLADPLSGLMDIVKGYSSVQPLSPQELKALFPLVGTRLLISVTVAHLNALQNPDNAYLQISANDAWTMLKKWRSYPIPLVEYAVRHAAGLEPCPHHHIWQAWMQTKPAIKPVVDLPHHPQWQWLDLAVDSLSLGNNKHFIDDQHFEQKINHLLNSPGNPIGIGGYGEIRPFYTTDAYTVSGNEGPQWRTVHLGLDIWMNAGTKVFAPYQGVVHRVKENAGDRNYGPTIILKHQIAQGLTFYSLFGHLSRASLNMVKEGQWVAAGEEIGAIGPRPENGNWPPHLHFQVLLDVLADDGDFPGVAFPDEKDIWLSICPDPLPFSGIHLAPPDKETWTISQILDERKKSIGPNLSISYQNPLHIVRGYQQYLYHQNGRRYLDMVNNVAHVGHEHPVVVEAAQQQIGVLNTNSRYLHPGLVKYASRLLATFPEELAVCYLVNSGSEANELAIRLAKNLFQPRSFCCP